MPLSTYSQLNTEYLTELHNQIILYLFLGTNVCCGK